MFFIPLSQAESVELVIHALRAAGGEADCAACPAAKVCMKQCLTIAAAIEKMVAEGTLPSLGGGPDPDPPSGEGPGKGGHLKIVK